jgi:LacI family transcriptional regulator, repressor for deo operon, udp, cdd, tsx, nupC, and nupG
MVQASATFSLEMGLRQSQGSLRNDSPGQRQEEGLLTRPASRIVEVVPAETRTWVIATRPPATARRTTIADVAREAGVNKGTVSRALRGIAGVGASTRERIIETADRLDFSASHLATALASGQSRTVGIVLPTLRSWYFSEFASGASEILSPDGFRVELINLDVDSDFLDVESPQFRKLFRELGAGRGRDALLFAGTISVERHDESPGSATVPVSAPGSPLTSVPGIFVDHRAGGRLIAEHLLSLGHRNIGIFDGRMPGKPDYHVWDQRTDGLRDTVREAGFDIDSRNVIHPGDCHAVDGERAMKELLASGRTVPTAIFCHTDEMAFGAMAVLRAAGLPCPDEVSIAAFDDHPMSRWWGLTTVSQHAHEQGVRAANAMIRALSADEHNGDTSKQESEELQVELIVRGTTGPVRDNDSA